LAQPIRLLLEYTGTNYKDKFYVCGEAPDYDKSCWFGEKEKLGIDFANLPYLVDGDRKITQSNAIMRYIARKHNMCGETEDEKVRVDVMENQAMDFRNGFVMMCYLDLENKKPGYLKSLPGTLKQFSDFLGDRKWFAGDKVSHLIILVIVCFSAAVNPTPRTNPIMIKSLKMSSACFWIHEWLNDGAYIDNK
ncbi:Glutathione S-transferase Mu 2, partial [Xenotaenia resolanae]